jgi:hypothetical protein
MAHSWREREKDKGESFASFHVCVGMCRIMLVDDNDEGNGEKMFTQYFFSLEKKKETKNT